MKAEVNAKQSNTQTNIDIKINKLYKFTGKERTLTPQHQPTCSPLLFPGLALCSLATSTSIKKEINGPGASEWTHSQ